MKTIIGALIGVAAFAGAAQAQTVTTAFDQDITVNPIAIGSIGFDVTAPGESLYIQGLASVNSEIEGTATLSGPAGFSQTDPITFPLGSTTPSDYFNTSTLTPGSYTFSYELIDANGSLPDVVNVDATLTASAPEIDPASAASGLTLLAGALFVLRSRRRTVVTPTFA